MTDNTNFIEFRKHSRMVNTKFKLRRALMIFFFFAFLRLLLNVSIPYTKENKASTKSKMQAFSFRQHLLKIIFIK